jgi:hypothetical protein
MKLLITSLLCKIEPTPGTDSVPTGAANAVLLRGQPSLTPLDMVQDERNLLLPYFGNQGSMPSVAFGKLDFEFELAGSGTAGAAAPYGPILRACAVSETLTAAPVTGTAQVGGSTTSIKLAAAASAANDFYSGMPISITAGTGNGQSGIIVDYDGTTKIATVVSATWVAPDATSTYSIGANAVYRPISQSLEAVSLYFNIDGVLHKFLGNRGNASFNIGADKIPYGKASLTGVYAPVTDAAVPTVVVTAWQRPLVCNSINTPFFSLHGYAAAYLDNLMLDMGTAISKVSRIGVQRVDLTNRKPTGSVSMEAVSVATKDWWADCRAATLGSMGLIHGTVAGNKFALSGSNVILNQPKYSNSNGIAMIDMGMDVTPLNGNDEFAFSVY